MVFYCTLVALGYEQSLIFLLSQGDRGHVSGESGKASRNEDGSPSEEKKNKRMNTLKG